MPGPYTFSNEEWASAIERSRTAVRQGQSEPISGFNTDTRLAPTATEEPSGITGFLGDVLSPVGRAFEFVDKPLSDRLGIKVPEIRGPFDEIANFALQEATRPTNLAIALGGAGVAARLGASGSRAARGLGTVIQPISGSRSLPARIAAETAVSAGGRAGAEATTNLLPEDAGPIPTAISGIVGGLLGAGGAATFARRLAGGTRNIPSLQLQVNNAGDPFLQAPPLARKIFGAENVQLGTNDIDELTSRIRSGTLGAAPIDEIAAPIIKEQERIAINAANLANAESSRLGASVRSVFQLDPNGVTVNVRGQKATIADIAARLPEYEQVLTPQQMTVMRRLEEALAPYKAVLEESGADIGTRPDVMEGGFYIPRGNAVEEGLDVPKRYGRGGSGGKIGSEQEAIFGSQIEGINEGYEYSSIDNVIHGYIRDVGNKTSRLMTVNYMKNVTGTDGKNIAKTAFDMISPQLRVRVQSIRNKIGARRNTLIRRQTREKTLAKTQEQAQRRAIAGAERADGALNRVPTFSPAELAEARELRNIAIDNAVQLADWTRRDISKLQLANRTLTSKQRELFKTMDEISNITLRMSEIERTVDQISETALGRVFQRDTPSLAKQAARRGGEVDSVRLQTSAIRDLNKKRNQLAALENQLNKKIESVQDAIEDAALKVDDLEARGALDKDLSLQARADLVGTRKAERELYRNQSQFNAARREHRMVELEYNRLNRELAKDVTKSQRASLNRQITELDYDSVRDEWRDIKGEWERAIRKSQKPPDGYARVAIPELSQYYFPDSVANYINDWVSRQGPAAGKRKELQDVMENFNGLYRSIRATLDLSGAGIQTILGGYRRPKEWKRAVGLMFGSLKDNDVFGNFLQNFDLDATTTGRLTSRDWASRGAHFSSGADEFIIGGTKLADRVVMIPGIKQSNRAFGTVGDSMRLLWMDAELQSQLTRGRPLDDIMKSGDLDRIISSVNKMTGHSRTQFGGVFGDVALFAPRYLQSRLDTVAMGLRGLTPGAELDERMAMRSLMQMIGVGVGLTAAYNEFFGDDDFDYLSPTNNDGSYNSNFMRVRALGHDFSMFGPWDSLLRAVSSTASGDPASAVRGMASGTVATAWNFMSGETFMGDPTRDTPQQVLKTLAETVVPFSSTGVISNLKIAADGRPIEAATGQVSDMFGVKATPMTPFERLDAAARNLHDRPWVELSAQERDEVREKYPDIERAYDEQTIKSAERGRPSAILRIERDKIDDSRINDERLQMEGFANNLYDVKQFGDAIDNLQQDASLQKRTLEQYLGIEYDQTIPENQALSAWYDLYERAEIAPGITNYELRDQLEAQLMQDIKDGKYGDPARAMEIIEERAIPVHDQSVEWYFENKKIISNSGYYDQNDIALERIIGRAQRVDPSINNYRDLLIVINRAESTNDRRALSRLNAVKLQVERISSTKKEQLRRQNPELDEALVQNKGLTPIRSRRR